MKKNMTLLGVLVVVASFQTPAVKAADVPVTKGIVTWVGKKLTGSHTGTVAVKSGKIIKNDAGEFTGGEFVIDMSTLTETDIEDAEANQKLLNHLKSDDFFSIAKYPTATLVLTSIQKKSEHKYDVTANLTIKGISNEVSFVAKRDSENGVEKWTAHIVVDRTKYNIHFRSLKFFADIGDKVIYDEFELNVVLVTP